MVDDSLKADIKRVTITLAERFGRPATDDEVYDFIYGDRETQLKIWNQEKYKENT